MQGSITLSVSVVPLFPFNRDMMWRVEVVFIAKGKGLEVCLSKPA